MSEAVTLHKHLIVYVLEKQFSITFSCRPSSISAIISFTVSGYAHVYYEHILFHFEHTYQYICLVHEVILGLITNTGSLEPLVSTYMKM
jgi:hypothetical protein